MLNIYWQKFILRPEFLLSPLPCRPQEWKSIIQKDRHITSCIQNSVLSFTGHSGQCDMTSSELPIWCSLVRSEGDKVIFTVCGGGKNMTKSTQPFLNGLSTRILKTCHIPTHNRFKASYIRKEKKRPATTTTTALWRSGDPPWILKRARLESSGWAQWVMMN